ncbi:LTA synthase family protein [Desertivirga brevis]|uniref:LTA synthase family protein n=1 Tax=Desertivirga brevis TaxID=2810310 RepID=UPI001A970A5C|nr:LTA synthase family protein [Pedobacter sp. SYSU D00873]
MGLKNNMPNKGWEKFYQGCIDFAAISLTLLVIIFVIRIFEFIYNGILHQFPQPFILSLLAGLANSIIAWIKFQFFFWVLHTLIYQFSSRLANYVLIVVFTLVTLIEIALMKYFSEALIPLGADILGYSSEEIFQTLGSAGAFSILSISFFLINVIVILAVLYRLYTVLRPSKLISLILPSLSFIFLLTGISSTFYFAAFSSDYTNNLVVNKSDFFYTEIGKHFINVDDETDIYEDGYLGMYNDSQKNGLKDFTYIDRKNFPFLHTQDSSNVLSPFFKKSNKKPNIVIVLVEGLGRAFSNEGAYLGSFTPFLDSLSKKSVYFSNFLSTGGRTFAALPSILGSLPFHKNGFLELGTKAPRHLSLLTILKSSGYHTSFYYGGDSRFDKMDVFLKGNQLDELNDIHSFPSGYSKLPEQNGFSWGYTDKDLYRWFLNSRPANQASPQFSVLLSVASHSPFLLTEQNKYFKVLDRHFQKLNLNSDQIKEYQAYKYQYASILYTDDALKSFIDQYKKRPDFNNTIFLITGDHRMPEIPMSSKIDRYHVPFIIYSPLLSRTATIESVSTHFDIAPSLLSYLKQDYQVKSPSSTTWIGRGLDTSRAFRNIHSVPLMQTKTSFNDFISGEYHLNQQTVYKMSNNMVEETVQDKKILTRLSSQFNEFKSKNNKIVTQKSLVPDSIYRVYYPKKN